MPLADRPGPGADTAALAQALGFPVLLVVGLRVNLKQVTYACLDAGQRRLVSWDVIPLFENVNSQTHFHHHNLG